MKVILLLNGFKANKNDVVRVLIFLKSQKADFWSLGKYYQKLTLQI